ncbi:MAG: hypothetical protein ACOCVL_04065, partial [Candidatus Sumerlaeota bacterium]
KAAAHMNALIFYSFLTGRSCVKLDCEDHNGEFKDPAIEAAVKPIVWDVVQKALAPDEDEDTPDEDEDAQKEKK